MAVYLTNGKCYIAKSNTGAVIKVNSIEEAEDFHTARRAFEQKGKASGKCKGYDCLNTDADDPKTQRKRFTADERLSIYHKTRGHCYLCGEFVDFDEFEVEHKIPLAKGGTNELSNLFCSCHTCNTLKGSIAPKDLMEKIKQIHLHHIKKNNPHSFKWRIIYKALEEIL